MTKPSPQLQVLLDSMRQKKRRIKGETGKPSQDLSAITRIHLELTENHVSRFFGFFTQKKHLHMSDVVRSSVIAATCKHIVPHNALLCIGMRAMAETCRMDGLKV